MDYSKYMSEILTYQRIELDDAERSFLFKIINGQDSVYKILSYLKLRRQTMSYKNVQLILRRLQERYFIEEVPRKTFTWKNILQNNHTWIISYLFYDGKLSARIVNKI